MRYDKRKKQTVRVLDGFATKTRTVCFFEEKNISYINAILWFSTKNESKYRIKLKKEKFHTPGIHQDTYIFCRWITKSIFQNL